MHPGVHFLKTERRPLGVWQAKIKTPKLYFADPGLLCHLLGIESAAMKGYQTRPLLVHRSGREKSLTRALSGGASAVPANELAGALGPRQYSQ